MTGFEEPRKTQDPLRLRGDQLAKSHARHFNKPVSHVSPFLPVSHCEQGPG